MLKLVSALALVALMVAPAHAADPPRTDVFVAQVSGGNTFEIESSKLAMTKTKAEPVRSFANEMVADHTAAAAKFKQALSEAKVNPPREGVDAKHKAVLDDLQKKDGAGFDKAYVEAQHKAHTETVELFEAYGKGGDNARLKQFAQEMLPTLRKHLEHVRKLH